MRVPQISLGWNYLSNAIETYMRQLLMIVLQYVGRMSLTSGHRTISTPDYDGMLAELGHFIQTVSKVRLGLDHLQEMLYPYH